MGAERDYDPDGTYTTQEAEIAAYGTSKAQQTCAETTGDIGVNIFYLDRDPQRCAAMHCDKHVVKMILEYAQLLSTAHHEIDGVPSIDCYKATHKNHPSAVWARENRSNYSWLHLLLQDLCSEYTLRYGKVHKTEERGIVHGLSYPPYELPSGDFTDPPQCMPDYCKTDDAVIAYRTYYIKEKSYMAKWKNGNVPTWYRMGMVIEMYEAA